MRKSNREKAGNPIATVVSLMVIMGVFAWWLFQLDLTSFIFDKHKAAPEVNTMTQAQYQEVTRIWNEQQQARQTEKAENSEPVDKQEDVSQQNVGPYPREAIFQYIDKSGLIVMVDNIDKIPPRYRKNMKIIEGGSGQQRTPIDVVNNQVYVPVSLTYRGRTVTTRLLLDTGATGITISPALAQRLGAQPTSQGNATLADGKKVQTHQFICDHVSVGSKNKNAAVVSIMPREDSEETGLLGMSFLADFPHTIDLKARVIKWF
ncbi:retropepsin-like aspartic protease [Geobacter grbiciae]|uniref:retropepsin-like aspartic protease n=1 Tax=Geobacter grbiciae TaxID=155042 RepID=UPI001C017501|nr:retropepsin-like aspartic protease [Geobacter grbiciae]MBT1073781.1 retroviral-like aspartic protease family protein [Geobacter grbiciae]